MKIMNLLVLPIVGSCPLSAPAERGVDKKPGSLVNLEAPARVRVRQPLSGGDKGS